MGAALYKIEAAVRIGTTTNVSTDIPCQWNQTFTKSIVGSPVVGINLYSDAAKRKLSTTSKFRKVVVTSIEDKMEFLSKLQEVQPNTVVLHLFKNSCGKFIQNKPAVNCKLPPHLRTFYFPDSKHLNTDELNIYCQQNKMELKISSDMLIYVEEATRNQSVSHAWYEQRVDRITGSVFYQAYRTNIEKPSKSLIKKICQINKMDINVPALT